MTAGADKIIQDENRLVIEISGGVGDEIQFTKTQGGGLAIEIEEPWAGCTETGFGATTSITLKKEVLETLINWLRP